MGEARRRSKPLAVKGPFSYEIGIYRLDDILAGSLVALFADDLAPLARTLALVKAAAELAARMGDPRLPSMLCMTCPYEFARCERPAEIMVALPWAEPRSIRPIASPICAACAAAKPGRQDREDAGELGEVFAGFSASMGQDLHDDRAGRRPWLWEWRGR